MLVLLINDNERWFIIFGRELMNWNVLRNHERWIIKRLTLTLVCKLVIISTIIIIQRISCWCFMLIPFKSFWSSATCENSEQWVPWQLDEKKAIILYNELSGDFPFYALCLVSRRHSFKLDNAKWIVWHIQPKRAESTFNVGIPFRLMAVIKYEARTIKTVDISLILNKYYKFDSHSAIYVWLTEMLWMTGMLCF